ncbi:hypothetical protein WKH03_13335 [Pantoea agglomerans]|uniref:hypothetical protein n=1 Tax=Enterobacter agglomerans TaxID=549 RepID=UPI003C7D0337
MVPLVLPVATGVMVVMTTHQELLVGMAVMAVMPTVEMAVAMGMTAGTITEPVMVTAAIMAAEMAVEMAVHNKRHA